MSRGPGEATPSLLDAVDAVAARASRAGGGPPTPRREALEQVEPAEARHADVEDQAGRPLRARRRQELLGRAVCTGP